MKLQKLAKLRENKKQVYSGFLLLILSQSFRINLIFDLKWKNKKCKFMVFDFNRFWFTNQIPESVSMQFALQNRLKAKPSSMTFCKSQAGAHAASHNSD